MNKKIIKFDYFSGQKHLVCSLFANKSQIIILNLTGDKKHNRPNILMVMTVVYINKTLTK